MSNIPTAHNNAKANDFAKTVLMPGDPLRAKYIAETYLENPRQVTAVRTMLVYTGTYKAIETAKRQGTNVVVGNVLSSDVFYNADPTVNDRWRSMGVLAVEMEAAALYMNAAKAKKKALCMLTISDHIYTGEALSAEDRQLGFGKMMEIALELA